AMVACLPAGGVLADRVAPQRVMVASDVVRLGCEVLSGVLVLGGAADRWALVLLQGALGAGTGIFGPASASLVPLVVTPARLQQANGLRGMAMAAGALAGPALGGLVVVAAGAGQALLIDGASFAASALFLARVRTPMPAVADRPRLGEQLREGW